MKYFLFILFYTISLYSQNKVHVSLPNLKESKCALCHSEILKEIKHKPAENDCFLCHKFETKGESLYVGLEKGANELCFDCHNFEDYKKSKSLHPVFEECNLCHLPHSSKFKSLLKNETLSLCLDCHNLKDLKEKKHKNQPIEGFCINCHNPHFSNNEKLLEGKFFHKPYIENSCEGCHKKTITKKIRLILPLENLCFACHKTLEEEKNEKFLHKPFKFNDCLSCHNAHFSFKENLLKLSEKELCLSCHKDIKLDGKIHSPVENGCLDCHKPHSSQMDFLISKDLMEKEEISSLCFSCHTSDENLKKKHRNAKMENLECSICHNPHSSKNKILLNDNSVHPVFEDCSNCHIENLETQEKVPNLCFMCHSNIEESINSFKYKHTPAKEDCTTCHTPHISNYPPLLLNNTRKVCSQCHNFNNPYEHNVISLMGCNACHQPHGSNSNYFLKIEGNELCLSCHLFGKETEKEKELGIKFPKIKLDDNKERGHPTINHPVLGKPAQKGKIKISKDIEDLSCISCHNPHSGKAKNLYQFNKENQTQLCGVCHEK